MICGGFSVAVVSISFGFVEMSGRAEMVEIGNGLVGENLPYFGRLSNYSLGNRFAQPLEDCGYLGSGRSSVWLELIAVHTLYELHAAGPLHRVLGSKPPLLGFLKILTLIFSSLWGILSYFVMFWDLRRY